MPLDAYLELLDWTARQLVPGKQRNATGGMPQGTLHLRNATRGGIVIELASHLT